jgi:type I restriction enzyme S subunit
MTEHHKAMNLRQKHFDIALETPDGIKKLRELILTLAMQGKLVKQDPNDQPASELLKEIEAEKKRLVKEGKIKKQEPLPQIKPEEIPYAVPNGWEWVRLNDVSSKIHYGYTASANHDLKEIRMLRITDIQDNKVEWESVPGCEIKDRDIEQYLLNNNDLLIARTGGTVGKSYLVENVNVKAVFASYLIRIVPSVNIYARYLKYFIDGPIYWKQLYAKCSGTGQPNVNGTSLSTLLLTFPPLAEQKRIVTKIDQLMALCDKLEAERNVREQKRLNVNTAAINRLLTASDPTDFDKSWQFITKHFSELYAVPENVAELKKAILQLAVMGKLVKQDHNDQPANELLKEIEAEKKRLVKEGKIKKQETLPPIKPEEIPYAVPNGWEWVRIESLVSEMDAGWSPKCEEYSANENEWGVLKTTAVQPMLFLAYENKALPNRLNPRTDAEVVAGDILITRAGPKNRVGICCVVQNVRKKLMLSDKIIRFRIFIDKVFPKYCALSLNTGFGSEQLERMKSGMAESQMNISQEKLKQVVLPIPPLAEQKRIVTKIDQLMELCDKLEQQFAAATGKQTAILNAVLSKI